MDFKIIPPPFWCSRQEVLQISKCALNHSRKIKMRVVDAHRNRDRIWTFSVLSSRIHQQKLDLAALGCPFEEKLPIPGYGTMQRSADDEYLLIGLLNPFRDEDCFFPGSIKSGDTSNRPPWQLTIKLTYPQIQASEYSEPINCLRYCESSYKPKSGKCELFLSELASKLTSGGKIPREYDHGERWQ